MLLQVDNFVLIRKMILKAYIYFHIILVIEQTLYGQIMNNSKILKKYVFEGAPKLWFEYIKAFLLKSMKKIPTGHAYYTIAILRDTKNSSAFLHKISNRISYQSAYQSQVSIKFPIWNQMGYHENIPPLDPQKWILKLHKKLQANFTFDYINIFFNHLRFCKIGFVEIKSFKNLNSNQWTQIYCGFQSTLMCFPPHRNVEIDLLFERYTSYEILMRYSVTDQNRIISSEQNRTKYLQYYNRNQERQQEYFQWRINIPRQRVQLVRLILNFEKYKYLRITFPAKTYLVEAFDGPDTVSPMLQSNYLNDKLQEIVTSTFQCILNICIGCKSSFSSQNKLHINAVDITQIKNITLNDENVSSFSYQYNTKLGNQNVYIMRIWISQNFILNITVKNVSHNYNRNYLYIYGGFVIFDRMDVKENSQSKTKCYQHTNIFRYQNIYSNSSSILLVAYSYREYGSMNLTIGFSTTNCNIVRVNCENWDAAQSQGQCMVFQFTNYLLNYDALRSNKSSIICKPYRNEQPLQKYRHSVPDNLVLETFTTGYLKGKIHFK